MTDKETVQRNIAAILDHPSVFMGGPSRQNMKKAEKIIYYLQDCKILLSALEYEK